jgi:nitrile hydratase beta subunit
VDGIHDLGGMHGFGPVQPAGHEPPFDDWWQAHAFALSLLTGALGLRSPSIRPGIEALDPAVYLTSDYYERWARSLEAGLVESGTLDPADIEAMAASMTPGPTSSEATNPELVATARTVLATPGETSGVPVDGRFRVGDRVTVLRMAPEAHHRCPRYVRGVDGVIERAATAWPHPGSDEPEPVYTVRFSMRDLWGKDAEPGSLYIDLWERYLT